MTIRRIQGRSPTQISEDCRLAVVAALARMSRRCDGARKIDDQGWNKFHAADPELARLARLGAAITYTEASWARGALNTYRNTQLKDLVPRLWPSNNND